MKIALDVSPISDNKLGHKFRGSGFYIENLKKSLLKYFPNNTYVYFDNDNGETKEADLVHFPYFDPFFLTLPFIARNKIVTVHDLIPFVFPKYFPAGIKGNLKWKVQKLSLMFSKAIITDSLASKNDIVKFTGVKEDNVYVVYLAADERYAKVNDIVKIREVKRKYDLPEGFVLYVGDVTWNKNLPRVIEAIKKINLNLVLVGRALMNKDIDKKNLWNKDLIRIRKATANDKRFKFLGFVPADDLVSIYNLAKVFSMPSLYEGFGLPVLEAANCGCPVVTSKSGSLPEVMGESAFYVDPYKVDDIADGVYKVYKDEKLQEDLSFKGISQAKNFSWGKTAKETMKVYEKILKR